MKQFYLTYQQGSALPEARSQRTLPDAVTTTGKKGSAALSLFDDLKIGSAMLSLFPSPLGWTHYIILMKVKDEGARAFYEIEAAREGWTTRNLDRQITLLLYNHRPPRELPARARQGLLLRRPAEAYHPRRRPLLRRSRLLQPASALFHARRPQARQAHADVREPLRRDRAGRRRGADGWDRALFRQERRDGADHAPKEYPGRPLPFSPHRRAFSRSAPSTAGPGSPRCAAEDRHLRSAATLRSRLGR